MAQLKVKQILDFVTAVADAPVGTATGLRITDAKSEAISDAATDATGKANTAKSEAISDAATDATGKANDAQSAAISAALSADSTLSSAIEVQKERIDALLLNSTEALDTFAEIESFITSLETSNISGLSAAIATSVSNDGVHTAAITENAAAITALEAVIMEDNEERVESFTGNGLVYNLEFAVQDGNKNLVEAFVNGHRVTVTSLANQDKVVNLAAPGYTIDNGDTVVITYQSI